MLFSDLCALTPPAYFGYAAQFQYTRGLFAAARINRKYSDDYLKAVFNGSSHFNANMKKHFPKPVDTAPIAEFYEKHLKPEFIDSLADVFGIPADIERNTQYLSIALAEQVKAFIESKEEDVENIIPASYEKARINTERKAYSFTQALYEGDDVWVEERSKTHDVNCYDFFTQTWVIHNQGRNIWHNRKLVCVSDDKNGPRISQLVLDVPEVKPNGLIKISTDIDARGMEGKFISLWDMRDSSGSNCFPNIRNIFDVTINVKFQADSSLEVFK